MLSGKLRDIFKRLSGKGRLSEKDIDEALRQVRLALLEADVNLKVVKSLIARVRERALRSEVLESLSPGQQVIKIVNEELISVLGGGMSRLLQAAHPPTVLMVCGLHGSGKTTTAAKLALHLRQSGQRPLLVALDVRRPAAIEQLIALGRQLDIPVYSEGTSADPVTTCGNALKRAREIAATSVVADTAGLLHIDEALMKELAEFKEKLHPSEVLLVVDAMTGQEAVRIAEEFNRWVGITGLILTKMDGDARGGAALSITEVTGVPIKFIGTGEKPDAFEPFHPDRLASRILGMGDVLTIIERAERAIDQKQARELERKVRTAAFDLEDFLEQLKQVRRIGSLDQLLEMIPGLSSFSRQMPTKEGERQLKKAEAIILSMTPEERRNPSIIDGSRRRRIARGSGTTVEDINQLLNQFRQAQKLMKQMAKGKGMLSLFRR